MDFNTLHIYKDQDNVLYINNEETYEVAKSSLTTLDAFINAVKALRSQDKEERDYRLIHVFNKHGLIYAADEAPVIPEQSNSFKIDWKNHEISELEVLINEIQTLI